MYLVTYVHFVDVLKT